MKIIFMGTPDFAVSSLNALYEAGHEILLVVTQPDKKRGRGGEVSFSDVKQYAVEHNLPVFQPVKIREPEAVDYLRQYEADLFVVAAFGQILPKEILDMPRLGCINVHASLLPKYRGAAPIQWSILNGEEKTGVTIMQMGVGLDDGDILTQVETEIGAKETGGQLFDRLAELGSKLLVDTIPMLDAGQITPIKQEEGQATKVGMIKKQFGQIDFNQDAARIERYIRGLNPWPCCYTVMDGKTLKIWDADVLTKEECMELIPVTESADDLDDKACGRVDFSNDKYLIVKCGINYLKINELQMEGKKRMKTEDFLRGHAVPIGSMLG